MLFFEPITVIEVLNFTGQVNLLKGDLDSVNINDRTTSLLEINKSHQVKKEQYLKSIEKSQEYIRNGDFYEINISHQMEYSFKGEPYDLYQLMKQMGPVPFGAFFNFDGFSICSVSPERFLSKKNTLLTSEPIKGTRVRNPNIDLEKEREGLQNSSKEKAENLMIVDLVRNDLSKVSQEGSVQVKRFI